MGVGGQHHAPAALPPVKTRYPLYRRLGGPQGRSGRVWKISPPLGFDPRTVHPVASRYTDWAIAALTEMTTSNIFWGCWRRPEERTDFLVPIVYKFGNFRLLKTSGPVQACNGNDLHSLKMSEYYLRVINQSLISRKWLSNIVIEFGIPMKQIKLIKICLTET